MPGIVQRPTVVEEAVDQFAGLFANQCQRKHFGNYLTGLMVGRNSIRSRSFCVMKSDF